MQRDLREQSLIAFYFTGQVARDQSFAEEETLRRVSRRAYRDLNRTITGMGSLHKAEDLREEIHSSIISFVNNLDKESSRTAFDDRHHEWCEKAMASFHEHAKQHGSGVKLHYGQSQKWLNMTLKYLAVLGHEKTTAVYPHLHAPVDKFVVSAATASEGLGMTGTWVKPLRSAWSKIGVEDYTAFQEALRASVEQKYGGQWTVMDWEVAHWAMGSSTGTDREDEH